jgi:hypothetical protein
MSEQTELKPCPFCGSCGDEVALYRGWFVRCHVCHVETVHADTEAEAIAAWSRRASPAVQAVPTDATPPLATFKRALLAYADEEYCRSLRMFRTDPCLGWEAKVKNGKYGPVEHNAHKEANEHMGAHRGIYAAVKFVEDMLAAAPAAPIQRPGDHQT